MASPQKYALKPMIQGPNGTLTVVFNDGSSATMDANGMIVSQDDAPNPIRAAMMLGGRDEELSGQLAVAQADEDTRRFDLGNANQIRQNQLTQKNYENQAREIEQNHKVALMGARTAQDVAAADQEYKRAQVQLARETLTFNRESFAQTFGEGQRQFDVNTGLAQAGLGMRGVETAASLRGPEDYFVAADYARGFSQMPGSSGFLSALQNNTRLADFGKQGGVPQPETMDSLTAKLQGGGNPNTGSYLAQIGNVAAKGAHQVGAGVLEQFSPTESKLFTAGLSELGYDPETFLSQHRRSRIGQTFSGSRAA